MARNHMERTATVKHTFTPEDTYARARTTIEQCLLHGVTHMRTQVEVDPNVGLIGFEAIEQLRKDYAWAIDIQPCLPAGRLDRVSGADENLVHCLERGAPAIGGGIRYDKDGPGQIRRVFELARRTTLTSTSTSTAATSERARLPAGVRDHRADRLAGTRRFRPRLDCRAARRDGAPAEHRRDRRPGEARRAPRAARHRRRWKCQRS